jgi:hypothetical protein
MVKLTDHDSLSGETVLRRLADNDLKPWRRDTWCIPHVDGEYVARMEDVLDLYAEAPDPARPLVCFDETPAAHRRGLCSLHARARRCPLPQGRLHPCRAGQSVERQIDHVRTRNSPRLFHREAGRIFSMME